MLLITRNQRRDAGFSAFLDRVVRHMKWHYWHDVALIPPEILRRRCAHCIEVGRSVGFTYERSLANFTANMFRINPRFYQQKAIAELLADLDRPEQERLEGLVVDISPREWDEAEMQCDADAYWQDVDQRMADPSEKE